MLRLGYDFIDALNFNIFVHKILLFIVINSGYDFEKVFILVFVCLKNVLKKTRNNSHENYTLTKIFGKNMRAY